MTFNELGLAAPLLQNVTEEGYTTPTPIQAQAIPHVIAGKDLLGCAQTGTGKTAAFALPMMHRMMQNVPPRGARRPIRGLVLSPTRELAAQIGDSLRTYGRNSGVFHTVIFGGVNQYHQVRAIDRGVDILVATPGRLLDLIGQGFIRLDAVEFFVLDEADRMLDMGFMPDIERVIPMLPEKKQTLLFSATMPGPIRQLADGLLHEPVSIQIEPVRETTDLIDQSVCFIDAPDKGRLLVTLIKSEQVSRAVVFARTKMRAERVVRRLQDANIPVDTMHSDKSQSARQRALYAFKGGQVKVLVATDIAARGLDVDNISHVFNFDMPRDPETYVHRIGRTGRAGARGTAISFVARDERRLLSDVQYFLNQRLPVRPLPQYLMDEEPQRPFGMREERDGPNDRFANNAPNDRFANNGAAGRFAPINSGAPAARNVPFAGNKPVVTAAPAFNPMPAAAPVSANLADDLPPEVVEEELAAVSLARELLAEDTDDLGEDELSLEEISEIESEIGDVEAGEGDALAAESTADVIENTSNVAAAVVAVQSQSTMAETGAVGGAYQQQPVDPFQTFDAGSYPQRDERPRQQYGDRRRERGGRNDRGDRGGRNDRRPQYGEGQQQQFGEGRPQYGERRPQQGEGRPQYGERRPYGNDRQFGGPRRDRGGYGQSFDGGQQRNRGPRDNYRGNFNDGPPQQRYGRSPVPPDSIGPAAQAGAYNGGQGNEQPLLYVRQQEGPGYAQPGEQGGRPYGAPQRSYFAGPAGAANEGAAPVGNEGGYQPSGVQYGQRQPYSNNDQGEGFWPKRRRPYEEQGEQGAQGGYRQGRQQGGYGQQQSGGRRFGGNRGGQGGQGGGYGDRRQGGSGGGYRDQQGGGGYGQQRGYGDQQQGARGQGYGEQRGQRRNYDQGGGYQQGGTGATGGYGRGPFRKKFGGSAPRYS